MAAVQALHAEEIVVRVAVVDRLEVLENRFRHMLVAVVHVGAGKLFQPFDLDAPMVADVVRYVVYNVVFDFYPGPAVVAIAEFSVVV